ncbi:metal-sensitive transcriptional regulator [Melghirimyces algeriensis]|uniref:DNA-binding transcriptional regulator, FrmR family n=1 Tax=Melghirimyces algeriensis TaxID=910412 RepID=A0A521BN45_9BACL|nr:metal-sensitive transcriptional regulator [Melghirimyces algeriensis]SMO48553.1 DNA-binding transcriptional regulator, FrmR family [Melghirimyces algeriensis]
MSCDKEKLLRRLKRVEGQIRGIQKMVEEDRYCMDILIQLAAVKSASNSIGLTILENHAKSCVTDAIHSGKGDEAIEEMAEVLRSFIK